METPHTWRFATLDTTPFVLEGGGPQAGGVGVPLRAMLEVAYKELLAGNEATVTFRLERLGDSVGQAQA